jgi:hypothetical protein
VDTIEVQRDICRKYCEYRGLNPLVELADELVSARCVPMLERPNGSKIPDLVAHGIKDIVAVRLDRVFRDTVDGLQTLSKWNSSGVFLHLASGGHAINCGDSQGTMLVTFLLGVAAYEPGIIAERTKASMLYRQKNGQRMTHEDKLPWGWMVDPDSKDNERGRKSGMMPCIEERETTVDIRQRISGGASLSFIAVLLNGQHANGLGCLNRGKPWNHKSVKRAAEAKWS